MAGPLLFNVFICDMFYFLEDFDIANYGDDSTPYNADKNIEFVVNNLEQSSSILFKWLNGNCMKVNTDNIHLLVSGNVRATAKIYNINIESEKEQVLLGITIDSNLTFENHIHNIFKRASQKCPCKNGSIHEYAEKKNNHEIFCNVTVWVLSVNLDVP